MYSKLVNPDYVLSLPARQKSKHDSDKNIHFQNVSTRISGIELTTEEFLNTIRHYIRQCNSL